MEEEMKSLFLLKTSRTTFKSVPSLRYVALSFERCSASRAQHNNAFPQSRAGTVHVHWVCVCE